MNDPAAAPVASSAASSQPILRFTAGRFSGDFAVVLDDVAYLAADGARVPRADAEGEGATAALAKLHRQADGWWLSPVRDASVQLGAIVVLTPMHLDAGARIVLADAELVFELVATDSTGTRLVAVEGALKGVSFALSGERSLIGRVNVPVAIGNDATAQEHAELRLHEGAWHLSAKEARCLLSINSERIRGETRLKTGDRLKIGSTVLEFIDGRVEALTGTSLGEVMLATRIGCGSLGAVFRARDAAGAAVAVKVLDPGLAQDLGARARFINGARNQQRLNHPNVVRVIGVHTDANTPAVIMEWLPNGSLAERLANGQTLDAPAAIALLREVAQGLAAGAKLRMFHQGLRPANLLFDANNHVQVADFALCAPYDPLSPAAGGDPRYAAPEEVTGAAADALANQFSLGLVLFQALTGRVPFSGNSRDELARARIDGALPTIRSLIEIAPSLENLIARMLARRRDGRFATWEELLTSVDAFQSGSAIPEPPSGVSVLGGRARSALTSVPNSRTPPPPALEPRASSVRRTTADSTSTSSSSSGTAARRRSSIPAPATAEGSPSVPRITSTSRRAPSLSQQLGIPASAMSGLALVALLVIGLIVYSTLRARQAQLQDTQLHDANPGPTPAIETPATETPVEPAPAPVAAPTVNALAAVGPAPALTPTVLACTLVGGAGDQAISRIEIADDGRIIASGTDFSVIYSADSATGALHGEVRGDPTTAATSAFTTVPPLPTTTPRTARCGAVTLNLSSRSSNGIAYQPILRAVIDAEAGGATWQWWDWPDEQLAERGLGADARGYDVWPMPDGSAMTLCWSAAANSTLAQMPQNLDRPLPGPRPDGAASLYARVDPVQGRLLSALFLPAGPTARAVDAWGRVYVPVRVGEPSTALGMTGKAGLVVLQPTLDGLALNVALGGQGADEPGIEAIGTIKLYRNLLILGGTTAAKRLAVRNAVQRIAGSGQDGLLIILKLWDETPPLTTPTSTPTVPTPATPIKPALPAQVTPPAPKPATPKPAIPDALRDGLGNAL